MKLEGIEEGRRFFVTAIPRMVGTVCHQGSCGTRVKWDGSDQTRQIKDEDGEVKAEFTAPGKPVIISAGTEVTPL